MGTACKCKICKKSLNTNNAYCVVINGKRSYYCSAVEYEAEQVQREKASADKDKVYRLICDIIGRKEIINTVLWKEWAQWNKVASNEKIGQYLEENKFYLISLISRLDNVEFNRIRYLSTILKNKLGDFKPNTKEIEKPKIQIDETFYVSTTNNNKRRSLADLEDEF